MATIRRRGDSWQAQVRRAGHGPQSRTFAKRDDANRWARSVECDLDHQPRNVVCLKGHIPTLGELLTRYEAEITPLKRSNDRERDKLRVIRRSTIIDVKLNDIQASHIRIYRDERLRIVKPATVKREIAIIRHCISVAIGEWGFELIRNPGRDVVVKNADSARSRRLTSLEFGRFRTTLESTRVWYLEPIVSLALETGMRRGEILAIRRQHINFEDRLLDIPITKNGHSRVIPLTDRSLAALNQSNFQDFVFPINISTLRQSWLKLLENAKIQDYRFHDLRHEALSRFAEHGLSIAEISSISGHRTAQMLLRYTHVRPQSIAQKLAQLSSQSR